MAAGLSKRSGFQKLLKAVDGKKMYRHIFDLVKRMNFSEVLLVSNEAEIREYAAKCNFSSIENPIAESGKASTIRLGCEYFIDKLKSKQLTNIKGLYFFVCDQPYISEETVVSIKNKFEENGEETIVYPIYIGEGFRKRGNPVIFPLETLSMLRNLKKDEGGVKLIDEGFPSVFVEIYSVKESKDFDYAEDFDK